MGRLLRKGANKDRPVFLEGETVVGRWSGSHIQIDRGGVSAQHATIRWTAGGWLLRDLGSRNGTLRNGDYIPAKTGEVIEVGDELTFGEMDEVWIVESIDPPGLILRATDDADDAIHVSPTDGLRALPSPEEPSTSLYVSGDGCWFAESATGQTALLTDGAVVEVLQRQWRCVVPAPSLETSEPSHPIHRASVKAVTLKIAVARDEETAAVLVHAGGAERRVGPSVPLYLLAFLAGERATEPGWVEAEETCKKLNLTRERLNVDVYRVRESIRAAGVAGATDIIQRKPGMLRIGVEAARVSVIRGAASEIV